MRVNGFVLWMIIGAATAAAQGTDIPDPAAPASASATLPWEQFMDLRERARPPEQERRDAVAYEGASYAGYASVEKNDYRIRFEADIRLTAFHGRKILVPALSAELNPETMTVDGEPAGWIEKDGYFQVMLPGAGEHEIRAEFTLSLDARRWPRTLRLPLVPIPKTEIYLSTADAGIEARFEPGVVVKTDRGAAGGGDRIRGIAPAASAVEIRWLKRGEKREQIPLKMGAVVHTYASLGENGADLTSEITFRILQGETHYFRIRVPDGIDILDVAAVDSGGEGADPISQWYTEDLPAGRTVHIYAAYRHKDAFGVRLKGERTEARSDYDFSLPAIVPQGVERYESLAAVGSQANVEIAETAAEGAEARDVRFLPETLRAFAGGRALFHYKVLGDDFRLRFGVTSHDKAAVVETRIERMDADSVVTEAGTVMTKAALRVKNSQAQFLRLRLPNGAKLLSAFTSGREIRPALDGDAFLLPIDKSAADAFPVEIAWLSETGRFGAAGKNRVALPQSDLSIDELVWRVYAPEGFQVVHLGGNIDAVSPGWLGDLSAVIGAAASGQGRAAFAGMETYKRYDYNVTGLKKRFKSGRALETDAADTWGQAGQVRVQIPVTGHPYRFAGYLVKGFTPAVDLYYINGTLHRVIVVIYGLAGFAVLFWLLGLVFTNDGLPGRLKSLSGGLVVIFLSALLVVLSMVFKLGVFAGVLEGIAAAVIAFAFWQNRREAARFHVRVSGWPAWLPEVVFAGLLFLVAGALINEIPAAAVFFCAVSILFHPVLFRGLARASEIRKNRAAETAAVVVLLFSTILAQPPSLHASSAEAGPSEAQVHLPWSAVETLLDAIEAREKREREAVDADYLFGAAKIDGDISERYAALRIDVPLTLASGEPVKIPLVSVHTPVVQALYNDVPIPLGRDDETVYFETGPETARQGNLRLRVTAPVREKGGVKTFSVASPLLQGGSVILRFGTDVKSVRLYDTAWEKRDGRVVQAALGASRELRGELATFIRKQEMADESEKRAKKIYASTYTLISLEDDIATGYSSIRYRILNENVREFRIRLPERVVVHEIVGEDLERWRPESTENGWTVYRVDVMYPVAERYDLSVRYEAAIPGDAPFDLPGLIVEGVARDTGHIGVEMRGRGEIAIARLEKARRTDIRELPEIIRADADAPFVYAFRYVEQPYDIAFRIETHAGYRMDPAIADRIQYTRVVSPQGNVMSQARMWIRNSRKQYAAFTLPEGGRILSVFLDNESVKPSIDEKGGLLLPLKRRSAEPFVLDVVFEDATVDVGSWGGTLRLPYPRLDIPASIISSDVYVPSRMEPFEPRGDFRAVQSVDYVPWTSAGTLSVSGGFAEKNAPMASREMVQQQAQVQVQVQDMGNIAAPAGTLSLKIDIPKHGRRVEMNTFYVPAGESLETRLFMIRRSLFMAGYGASILLFIGVGAAIPRYGRRVVFWMIAIAGGLALAAVFSMSWKGVLIWGVVGFGVGRVLGFSRSKTQAA